MPPEIPHSRPFLGQSDLDAVCRVVASGQLAQGPVVCQLEELWGRLTGTRHAVCVGSGLAALRLALISLDVGSGDEVIVPAYSCVALINAVLATGAHPVFADVLIDRWTLSPGDVAERCNSRTKAIIAVHLFGIPAPVPELAELRVPIIEDCAHAVGGEYAGKPFGSLGTISIGSFYATKLVAGGEGGIVAANSAELTEPIRRGRDYSTLPPSPVRLNDKMTDLEAAIVLAQLQKLPETLRRRHEKADRYRELLAPLQAREFLILPRESSGRVWYRFAVRLIRHYSKAAALWMAAHGVHADQPIWDFRERSTADSSLGTTALAFDRVLSLPLYPGLTDNEQEAVCHTLTSCLESIA